MRVIQAQEEEEIKIGTGERDEIDNKLKFKKINMLI
jgi:hypothetical protein